MKKISIVAACYNESGNIQNMYQRIKKLFEHSSYDFELIYADNSSTDNSREIYENLIATDGRVKAILMSRNFGSSQPSFLAGLRQASGQAVVLIDGDLQDPPELITEFIKKYEEGFDVVYGVRIKRRGNILRRIGYTCFYRIFQWLSYLHIPVDAGDFGLMSRKVVDIIKQLDEKDLYIRGLRAWAGFKQTGVNYTRQERHAGKTSNSFLANFTWSKKAISNFSYKPLEFISKLAIAAAFSTFVAAFIYIYLYFKTDAPRGFSTLLMVMFIFGSIQLLALSIIAEYLIRIFQEVKNRPPYVISEILESKNIEKKE